jgi:hypothetical protein
MTSNRVSSAPHNVEQITRLAQDYEYNPNIPLKYWLRTANSLVKEVRRQIQADANMLGADDKFLPGRNIRTRGSR